VPELPEVETIRTQLEPLLTGRRLERVEIFDPRLTRPFDPAQVARELEGERITAVERRGKYMVLRFGSGRSLLIHLRMTGSLALAKGEADHPHARAMVKMDDGSLIVYRDVRRFGTWLVLDIGDLEPYLAERLGGEPLGASFRAAALASRLTGRRTPIKAALLDQRTVAGVGNIYADEALWRARIHPLRPAGELTSADVRRLHRAVRATLKIGIRREGATLRNYAKPDGRRGAMQEEFRVYGRQDEPCDRCGTPIEKTRAAGRGTWYCPYCQQLSSNEGELGPRVARARPLSEASSGRRRGRSAGRR
jgi:formamidopyrimidine-DNA glycosylase